MDNMVSPFGSHNVTKTDSTPYIVLEGLFPGHPYDISARSIWVVNGSLTIYGDYAPTAIVAGAYTVLVDNAQINAGDPVYACTC